MFIKHLYIFSDPLPISACISTYHGSDAAVIQFPQKNTPGLLAQHTRESGVVWVLWGSFFVLFWELGGCLAFFFSRGWTKAWAKRANKTAAHGLLPHRQSLSSVSTAFLHDKYKQFYTTKPLLSAKLPVPDLSYLSKGGKWKEEGEKTTCDAKFVNELWFTNATAKGSGGWWLGWLHLKIWEVINS